MTVQYSLTVMWLERLFPPAFLSEAEDGDLGADQLDPF